MYVEYMEMEINSDRGSFLSDESGARSQAGDPNQWPEEIDYLSFSDVLTLLKIQQIESFGKGIISLKELH